MIHFICVNYNGAHITKAYLESLAAQADVVPGVDFRAWVVDNASGETDLRTLDAYVSSYPWATLVHSPDNAGYFRGLNLGISACRRGAGDRVVVGNNDLEFAADFCARLSEYLPPPRTLVIAPDVVTIDGYHQNPHVLQRVSALRKLLYAVYFSSYGAARVLAGCSSLLKALKGGRVNDRWGTATPIHMGIGACYVLMPEFFAACGELDSGVFMYGEEALLAGQVMSAGGITYYEPGLRVRHLESATVSKLPSRRVYEFARSSYPIYREYL